jgi:hypothetical protein
MTDLLKEIQEKRVGTLSTPSGKTGFIAPQALYIDGKPRARFPSPRIPPLKAPVAHCFIPYKQSPTV